jgi:hypothetical protein
LLHELPDTDWQLAKSFRDTEASGGDGAAALFGRETLQLTRKTRNLSIGQGVYQPLPFQWCYHPGG